MSYAPTASEVAYAKVNLSLHLIDRQLDGYHQLDSVVAFVDIGDHLYATAEAEGTLRLSIDGAYGEGLSNLDNLIIRAAQLLKTYQQTPLGAHIRLTKNIPVGAGLGGGSADAAAALRMLNRLWGLRLSTPALAELGAHLGADVPACIFSQTTRMEGIGDRLLPVPHVPSLPLVLIYPNAPLWTPDVYGAMAGKSFSGRLSDIPTIGAPTENWHTWLHTCRNDLEQAATELSPHIVSMLQALDESGGCVLARMSGSGSACFGVFADAQSAEAAAQKIQSAQPGWWVRASHSLQ